MDSEAATDLVTIVGFGDEASLRRLESEDYYMCEEPIDYEADWRTAKIPFSMTFKKLVELREKYSLPHYIELLVLEAHERVCFLRPGSMVVSEYLFKAGTHEPLRSSSGQC